MRESNAEISTETQGNLTLVLARLLKNNPVNIQVVSAEGNIGAGHVTSGQHLAESCQIMGTKLIDHYVLQIMAGTNTLTKWVTRSYAQAQRNEKLLGMAEKLAGLAPGAVIDANIKSSGRPQELIQRVTTSMLEGKFNPQKPVVFVTTHGVAAESAIQAANLLNKRGIEAYVIEQVQDPWEGSNLRINTAASTTIAPEHHIITVHDHQTGLNYFSLRGHHRQIVLALGTPSNLMAMGIVERLSGQVSEIKRPRDPNHFAILCSGNFRPEFNERAAEFIRANVEKIKQGEIEITVHAMHDPQNKIFFLELGKELGLSPKNHFHLMFEETQQEAVYSRDLLKGGVSFSDQVENAPGVFMVTGGEHALEDFGEGAVVAVLLAPGHEERNTTLSAAHNHVLDISKSVPPDQYLEKIRAYQRSFVYQPRSLANFALLQILKPKLLEAYRVY